VVASIADHGRGEGADRHDLSAREGAIARERAGVADGWGRDVSGGRGRAAMGRLGHGREGECRRTHEREGRSGPEAAQPRGGFLFFSFFLFSVSYFYFLLLFLLSLFLLNKLLAR
jgi:hypothetical protein